jgi:hypothetical protein
MANFLHPFIGDGGYLYWSQQMDNPSDKWSDGTAAPDSNFYRGAEGRQVSDFGIQAKKLMARGGTQLQASDFALSAGWGDAASVAR